MNTFNIYKSTALTCVNIPFGTKRSLSYLGIKCIYNNLNENHIKTQI